MSYHSLPLCNYSWWMCNSQLPITRLNRRQLASHLWTASIQSRLEISCFVRANIPSMKHYWSLQTIGAGVILDSTWQLFKDRREGWGRILLSWRPQTRQSRKACALRINWSSVILKKRDQAKNMRSDGLTARQLQPAALTAEAYKKTTVSDNQTDSFQQTLIYSGKVGNKINIAYREFSNNIARPAFNNNVEYDLSESKTIAYKGSQLEILEATNQSIKFKVIKNFNTALR
jgi:hypothetical protein